MAKYALLVLATPKPGTEEPYDAWHTDVHVGEVLAVPGFEKSTAKRYRLSNAQHPAYGYCQRWNFLTIYEIETDNLQQVLDSLNQAADAGRVARSDMSDPPKTIVLAWYLVSEHSAKEGITYRARHPSVAGST